MTPLQDLSVNQGAATKDVWLYIMPRSREDTLEMETGPLLAAAEPER